MTAPFPPIEPPGGSALWANYLRAGIDAADANPGDVGEVVGVGGRLDPLSVLTAYRLGVFPMGLGEGVARRWGGGAPGGGASSSPAGCTSPGRCGGPCPGSP
ncbi:hypothetical protein [Janibacter sp. DB-40]|uniref:hypothetical protein n=1 Tax=Janibacter sp. DB-40 TaxID=3028808 RepID=UPI0032180421